MKQMTTAEERRVKARKIRMMTRGGDYEGWTMDQIADRHAISRQYAYQLVKELEDWEGTGKFEEQAREINEHHWKEYIPAKWMLCSGWMIQAYVNGQISRALLNGPDDHVNDVSIPDQPESDPLLK
jgi:hypothetical protein